MSRTLVDERGVPVAPPVGRDDPFSRSRKVAVLAPDCGPVVVLPPRWVAASGGEVVTDSEGTVLGTPGVAVNRLARASRASDTRRL